MNHADLTPAVALVLLALVAGCGSDSLCPAGSVVPPGGTTCVCPAGTAVPPGGSACEPVAMDAGMDLAADMGDQCRTACEGDTPICDVAAQACVGCLEDSHCQGALCEPTTHTCVECIDAEDCASTGGVCDPADNTCVECLSDANCGSTAPRCTVDQTCVECLSSTDCAGELCLEQTNTCVECLASTDCSAPTASRCDATNACAACSSHADCAHVTGLPACNAGTCVACTPETEATACGTYSCNRATSTCTMTPRGSLDHYQRCQADSECIDGDACVVQTDLFGPNATVCVPVLTEANCLQHLPLSRQQQRQSVDGQLVEICTLRANWLTLAGAQLLMSYERAPNARVEALGNECSTTSDCPANAICRAMHISGSGTLNVCTLGSCTSQLECPATMGCSAYSGTGVEYCAFWDF